MNLQVVDRAERKVWRYIVGEVHAPNNFDLEPLFVLEAFLQAGAGIDGHAQNGRAPGDALLDHVAVSLELLADGRLEPMPRQGGSSVEGSSRLPARLSDPEM